MLTEHLTGLGVPVLGGLPIGHNGPLDADGVEDQVCVPLGAWVSLDADAGFLTETGQVLTAARDSGAGAVQVSPYTDAPTTTR